MQEYLIFIYAAVAFLGVIFGLLKMLQKSAFKKSPLSVTFWKLKNMSTVMGVLFELSIFATTVLQALVIYGIL